MFHGLISTLGTSIWETMTMNLNPNMYTRQSRATAGGLTQT